MHAVAWAVVRNNETEMYIEQWWTTHSAEFKKHKQNKSYNRIYLFSQLLYTKNVIYQFNIQTQHWAYSSPCSGCIWRRKDESGEKVKQETRFVWTDDDNVPWSQKTRTQNQNKQKLQFFCNDYPGLSIRSVHALEYCNHTLLQILLENKWQFKSNVFYYILV